jgi:hypothetical protein
MTESISRGRVAAELDAGGVGGWTASVRAATHDDAASRCCESHGDQHPDPHGSTQAGGCSRAKRAWNIRTMSASATAPPS